MMLRSHVTGSLIGWWSLSLVYAGATGCQQSKTFLCGQRLCPAGLACAPEADRCVPREVIEACVGQEPGAACSVEAFSEAACVRGICEASLCGDSTVDADEVCDDGNTLSGDGCNADCSSDETCGNSRIDEPTGETCDDGNQQDDDGCSATCRVENCGNGVLEEDRGEVCDDGNTVSGDGCRADCFKIEVCGDVIVDEGEECDDGNDNPADGCFACDAFAWQATDQGQAADREVFELSLVGISDLDVAPDGRVFLADYWHHRIRVYDPKSKTVSTFAGVGVPGFAGDDGPATRALLRHPAGIALDAEGNLFIADSGNHRVRRVDALTAAVRTVAGNGEPGFSGDGQSALTAQLDTPGDVVVDDAGTLYISDTENHRIRRVPGPHGPSDAPPPIDTFAGNGDADVRGDDGDAKQAGMHAPGALRVQAANLWVTHPRDHVVRRIFKGNVYAYAGVPHRPGYAGDDDVATAAQLSSPMGLAVDALGQVYIADAGNHVVRRVGTDGRMSTVAGDGTAGFSGDGAPATDAQLAAPRAVALEPAGGLLLGDTENMRLRRVVDGAISSLTSPLGLTHWTKGEEVQLGEARALLVLDDRVFMASGDRAGLAHDPALNRLFFTGSPLLHGISGEWEGQHRVYQIEPRGSDPASWKLAPLAGSGRRGASDGAAQEATFACPAGLFFDPTADQLYVADSCNHSIRRLDLSSGTGSAKVDTVFGRTGVVGTYGALETGVMGGDMLLEYPEGITRCNSQWFIAETGNRFSSADEGHRVRRVDAGGVSEVILGDGLPSSAGQGVPSRAFPVDSPTGMGCDSLGNLFLTANKTVRLLAAEGGEVDGSGFVYNIFDSASGAASAGAEPPCLSGLFVVDDHHIHLTDACTGRWIEVSR